MNAILTRRSSEARVATPAASRYVAQLCKHFAHRVPASFDETRGRADFAGNTCTFDASEADVLILRVDASDEAALAVLEDVVARHLVRFAFRETLEIAWLRGPGGAHV
jgi:hypothetical protein